MSNLNSNTPPQSKSIPTCRACGTTDMEYVGEQPTRKGVLLGYHCQNPACKLFDSWQSFEAEKRAEKFAARDSLTVKARSLEVTMNYNPEVK